MMAVNEKCHQQGNIYQSTVPSPTELLLLNNKTYLRLCFHGKNGAGVVKNRHSGLGLQGDKIYFVEAQLC